MKSIKPGRGPSGMQAIASIAAVIFGLLWTILAASMGAPVIFPLFGVVFIVMGAVQAIYHFKNATGKNRFSSFDITEDQEEPDPIEQWRQEREENRKEPASPPAGTSGEACFCPYCGVSVRGEYTFCPRCGRTLP